MSAVFPNNVPCKKMQTQTALKPTQTSATPTLTLIGYANQAHRVHRNVGVFVEALLARAGLFGSFSLNVTGNATASGFPTDGVRLKNPTTSSVEILVQAKGSDYRYSGYLQSLDGIRPQVLHASLTAAMNGERFFDPKKEPAKSETNGETRHDDALPFVSLPEFGEAEVGIALSIVSDFSDGSGCETKGLAAKVIAEMGLGHVDPIEVEALVVSWLGQKFLEKGSGDKVKVTAKGRALFEAPAPPQPAPATPDAKAAVPPPPTPTRTRRTPRAEKNGHEHPSVPKNLPPIPQATPRAGQPVSELLAGMQQLLRMAQELGEALRHSETISGRIEEIDEDILKTEKALREKQQHREALERQRADYLKVTGSDEHKAARQFVLQLRGAKLDSVS